MQDNAIVPKSTGKAAKAKKVITKGKSVIFKIPSITPSHGSLESDSALNERVEQGADGDRAKATLAAGRNAIRRDSSLAEPKKARRSDFKRLVRLSIDTYEEVKVPYDDSVVIYPYRVLELRDYEDMMSATKIEEAAEIKRNELLDKLVDETQADPGTQNLLDRIDDALKVLGPESKEAYDAMVAEKTENKEWGALRYSNALYEGEVDKEALEAHQNGGDCLIRHGTGVTVTRDGERYEGQYRHDLREGFGWHFWPHGDYYRGQWSNNTMEGKGDYFYADGSWYVGDFKAGLRDGDGTMFWENGSIYRGQWADGSFHGDGQMRRADGKSYEGQWRFGKEHGEGLFIQEPGKKLTQYQGEFAEGVPHGKAIVLFSNGDEYFGDLVNGVRTSNEAIYKWANKRCYTGTMVKDRAVVGRLRDHTKQKVYEGHWKNNTANGDGTYFDRVSQFEYNGPFKAGKKHGMGICEWTATGNIYEGGFENDKKHGTGVFTWSTGESTWEGQFTKDLQHGMGVFRCDGKVKKEVFERYFYGQICNSDGRLCRPAEKSDTKRARAKTTGEI